jgi:AcrR family transcriptional regulator
VLDAALELIAAEGYAAVTMEAVARRCDVAKTAVYNAFPTREELLTALLEREIAGGVRVLAGALDEDPDDGDPLGPALRWLARVTTAIRENAPAWRLFLAPTDQMPPGVREAADGARAVAVARIRALMAPLLAERPELAGIDADMLAHSLYAVCEQGTRLMLDDPEHYTQERVLAFARDFLSKIIR